MLFNNETDYAIRIVACLAEQEKKTDAGTVAALTGVTPQFTLKILRRLMAADIVRSFKGAQGGYALSRSPKEITLLQVVETINGPIAVSRCQHSIKECTHPKGICSYRNVFSDVSDYMRERLNKETF